jgi:signal transduction histidine kinase
LDHQIGKVNIIPQEIGRVLLNIYNNAFYAVLEKAKTSFPSEGSNKYEPRITVTTRLNHKETGETKVEILVADNGNGIPEKIRDKIFQPFFTTKPAGQGTGLGLSMSFDIIKAHGGDIRVETKEGEGSEFIIQLPKQV